MFPDWSDRLFGFSLFVILVLELTGSLGRRFVLLQVLELAADVLKKVPDEIDYEQTAKIMADDPSPLNVVLLQEVKCQQVSGVECQEGGGRDENLPFFNPFDAYSFRLNGTTCWCALSSRHLLTWRRVSKDW